MVPVVDNVITEQVRLYNAGGPQAGFQIRIDLMRIRIQHFF
jgi:hypothetical protein